MPCISYCCLYALRKILCGAFLLILLGLCQFNYSELLVGVLEQERKQQAALDSGLPGLRLGNPWDTFKYSSHMLIM